MTTIRPPADLERRPVSARLRWWAGRFDPGEPGSRRLCATLIEAATELELQASGPSAAPPIPIPRKET